MSCFYGVGLVFFSRSAQDQDPVHIELDPNFRLGYYVNREKMQDLVDAGSFIENATFSGNQTSNF